MKYLLVACEDPDADARGRQTLDALRDAVLQLVLDGGAAQQLQPPLDLLSYCRQPLVPPLQRSLCSKVPLLPPACIQWRLSLSWQGTHPAICMHAAPSITATGSHIQVVPLHHACSG